MKAKAQVAGRESEIQGLKQKEGRVMKELNNLQEQHHFLK